MRKQKRLGQNFLVDESIIARIVSLEPLKSETVLEIGAGTGFLTKALAQKAKKVIALELDEELFPVLRHNTRALKNVQLLNEDALEHDFNKYRTIFGNIPYSISSPLLFKIIESSKVQTAVLMLQKEYAARLVAHPGSNDYSRLTVMAQSRVQVHEAFSVPRYAFSPVPKVDSTVVILKRKDKPVPLDSELVNLLFQHKNQTVRNAMLHSSHILRLPRQELSSHAAGSGLGDRKVKSLRLDELSALSAFLTPRVRQR